MARAFHVIVERDEDGWYVGTVSELPGCHTQARSLDQLRTRLHEAIRAYIGPRKSVPKGIEFMRLARRGRKLSEVIGLYPELRGKTGIMCVVRENRRRIDARTRAT